MDYVNQQDIDVTISEVKNSNKCKGMKGRVWLFIFWEESAPDDWEDIIESWHVPCVVSPLHCNDFNSDGTFKKFHRHGVLSFSGNKSYSQVKALIEPLGFPYPWLANDLNASLAYLCHLNSPDKYQYPITDCLCFHGLDLAGAISSRKTHDNINDVLDIIDGNGITEFCQLVSIIRTEYYDYLPTLINNHRFFESYIRSCRYCL